MQTTTSQTGAAEPANKDMRLPVRRLVCCVCGAATKGRQWWNRDTGYGLCERCADSDMVKQEGAERMRSYYGVRGVHYCLGAEPVVEPANVRVIIQNESGQQVSPSCTLGEFLSDNPELVVGPADILQVIEAYGRWVYDGGAGGVFYLVPEPKNQTAAAVDEILRAATAWYAPDAVPVKWLAVIPAMRAAPELAESLAALLDQVTGPAQVYGNGIGNNGIKTGLSHQEFNALRDVRIAQARTILSKIGGAS